MSHKVQIIDPSEEIRDGGEIAAQAAFGGVQGRSMNSAQLSTLHELPHEH